jgi:type I restriction enzyme M protein
VLFFDRMPAAETPWTRELWVYDLRTNIHFTLKQNRVDSLEDTDNLPPPEVIAQEIVEGLEAALADFAAIADRWRTGRKLSPECCSLRLSN